MSLHALLYCERLFYLEEVEEIRVADAAVYAGRRLHHEVASPEDETPEQRSFEVSSERWGLVGKVDAVRRRDGHWVAIEHKRGRCRRDDNRRPEAWPSDRIQAVAYAVLLEKALAEPVPQARVRYHADGVTAFVDVDQTARRDLETAIRRARELRESIARPPVAENERLCPRCSLAPICLPEEERLAHEADESQHAAPRLFPSRREEQTLHIVSPRAYLGRSGDALLLTNEEDKQEIPIEQIDSVVIHGFGQVSTQAIHLCSQHGVSVQCSRRAENSPRARQPRPDVCNSGSGSMPAYPIRPHGSTWHGGWSRPNRKPSVATCFGQSFRACLPRVVPSTLGANAQPAWQGAQGRVVSLPARL